MMVGKIFYLSVLLFLCACQRSLTAPSQVCFNKNCFDVELADTDEARFKGLQNRTSLKEHSGMLFVFPYEAKHSFWMKETLIALDMIWLDYSHRVVFIAHDVPPCKADPCPTYSPNDEALYVLEINAGEAKRLGIKKGDEAIFRLNDEFRP
jgi:uncharacterized membrane protein (UPF0127 family)